MDPKTYRIVQLFKARLEQATRANGFLTDIGLNVSDWPLITFGTDEFFCAAYRTDRATDFEVPHRQVLDGSIIIEAHANVDVVDPDRAKLAEAMLADIQQAIEVDVEDQLEELLWKKAKPVFIADQIDYSDAAGDRVSVYCSYSINHLRKRGDPELA